MDPFDPVPVLQLKKTDAKKAVAVATLDVPSSSDTGSDPTIGSRYNNADKDAYRERKRLAELEKTKAEKAKRLEEEKRVKEQIAREKEARLAAIKSKSSTSTIPTPNPSIQPSTVDHKPRSAASEAFLKRLEAQRSQNKEAVPTQESKSSSDTSTPKTSTIPPQESSTSSTSDPALTRKEKKEEYEARRKRMEKESWQLESVENNRRLAELRAIIRQEREAKAIRLAQEREAHGTKVEQAPTSTEHLPDHTPLVAPPEDVSGDWIAQRRARLGVTHVSSDQAHSTEKTQSRHRSGSNSESEEETDDIDEIKRRNKLLAARSSTTQNRPTLNDNERNIRVETILQKMSASSTATSSVTPVQPPKAVPKNTLTITVRLPDGRVKSEPFKENDTIEDVHKFAASWLPLDTQFTLLIPVPRQVFDESMFEVTILDAGLARGGRLTVLLDENQGVVTPAPARPENWDRISPYVDGESEMQALANYQNMSYEELLELQEQMGVISTGFTDSEKEALVSSAITYTSAKNTSNENSMDVSITEESTPNRESEHSHEEEEEHGINCLICQYDVEDGEEIIALPKCKHQFHKTCILQWFEANRTCPTCRHRIYINPEHKI